jgi:chromosomal replication initiation ATPase DnaA
VTTKEAHVVATVVATEYFLTATEIFSPARERERVEARQIAWWLLRTAGWSFPRIGRFSGFDHSSVLHGVRVVEARRLTDSKFYGLTNDLRLRIAIQPCVPTPTVDTFDPLAPDLSGEWAI